MSNKDYRPANEERKELFKKYYHWSLKTHDCDPALFLMNYVNKRMELNIEQRYWFAWLYGNTYNVSTAWILLNEFPDFENVDEERLYKWNQENYKRLRYQVDNKWQKGHLPAMFDSYKRNIMSKGSTQKEYFDLLCNSDSVTNFYTMQKEITKNWFKFGRYLSWFYLQTLKETCDLDVEPKDLLLKESSSKSHRNGLIYSLGLEYILDPENDIKIDKEMYDLLDNEAGKILSDIEIEYGDVDVDYFSLETTLCAFKKIFRRKHGRYLGYYLDRQAEDIKKCEQDSWIGIDWQLLWDGRNELIDSRLLRGEVKEQDMWEFLETGNFEKLNWYE
jgi:hypothetical protein